MPRLSAVLLSLSMLTTSGCAHRIWFTQPVREGFELGVTPEPDGEAGLSEPGRAPSELQYFVSERIVLQREARSRNEAITHGRILVRRGRYVEEVLIRKGTPGVAVDWGPDWVAVSFEKGTQLIFDLVQPDDDAPGTNRAPAGFVGEDLPSTYYQLRTRPDENGEGAFIEIRGKSYAATKSTARARLKVKRHSWTRHKRTRRVMRGRRIH